MTSRHLSAVMASAAVGLAVPFAAALAYWAGGPGLLPADEIQLIVFASIVLRAVIFLGSPRVRRLGGGALVVFFSGDIFILPMGAAAYLITGDAAYGGPLREFLASWLSSSLLVYPGIAGYLSVRSMAKRARLAYVLPTMAAVFGVSTMVVLALSSASWGIVNLAAPRGLVDVSGSVLNNLRSPGTASLVAEEVTLGGGVLLFFGLALYSVTASDLGGRRLVSELALCILGMSALVLWVVAFPPMAPWLKLGLPTAMIVSIIWVMTRG